MNATPLRRRRSPQRGGKSERRRLRGDGFAGPHDQFAELDAHNSQMTGGSASAFELSRPAQASLLLRPIGSLSGPKPPSSQGSDPASCPTEPPASFRTNRQLSG